MGGSISVVFADIYMCKMGHDVADPIKPVFYKEYVDNTYVKRKKNTKDELFEKLKIYYEFLKSIMNDYIIHKIYTKNVIEPMCKRSIFKKLLIKLTKECTFSVNN